MKTLAVLDIGDTNISDISFLENNKNVEELRLNNCKFIEDFTPISKLEKIEILAIDNTNISDVSFLEKNKNIKELYLNDCHKLIKKDNIFKRKDIKIHISN